MYLRLHNASPHASQRQCADSRLAKLVIQLRALLNIPECRQHDVCSPTLLPLQPTMIALSTSLSGPTHNQKRPIHRVALACVQCRSRKVRCDANLPHCIRCQADGKTCEYQKSRRGGKIKHTATGFLQTPEKSHPAVDVAHTVPLSTALTCNTSDTYSSGRGSAERGSVGSSTHSTVGTTEPVSPLINSTRLWTCLTPCQTDQLLSSYYTSFHVAHPCVLPRWSLQIRLANEPDAEDTLLPVLLFIGSIFTSAIDSEPLKKAAQDAITFAKTRPGPSPFYLQALLLYAIAIYASNEPERGRQLMAEAIRGATSVGMQRSEFAAEYGQGDPILEESWRRTWCTYHLCRYHMQLPVLTGITNMQG